MADTGIAYISKFAIDGDNLNFSLNIINRGCVDWHIPMEDIKQLEEFLNAIETNDTFCEGKIVQVELRENTIYSITGLRNHKTWYRLRG